MVILDERPGGDGDQRQRQRRHHDRAMARAKNFWLAVLTGLYVWAFVSLQHQQNQLKTTRVQATEQRCDQTRILLGLARFGGPRFAEPLRRNLADCERLLATYRDD